MSAEALRSALAGAGLAAEVEERERLAIIRPAGVAASRAIAAQRARVITLAAAHGFSHVALEVGPPARRDATLPRD